MRILHRTVRILFNILLAVMLLAVMFRAVTADGTALASLLSDNVFGGGTSTVITSSVEPVYYKTWYSGVDDVLDGNGAVGAAAEAEGAVLLRNRNGALPLDRERDGVSVFGAVAYSPMYSLGGAGSVCVNSAGADAVSVADSYAGRDSSTDRRMYIHSELEKMGLNVNGKLASYYTEHIITDPSLNRGMDNSNGNIPAVNGEVWADLDASSSGKTASGYDTAIFVVGRMGTEAADMSMTYLTFTDRERSMMESLKKEKDRGTFKKIILIFNQGNPMQEDIEGVCDEYSIDAAMWIGYPGSDGLAGVAALLTGDSTPSGCLPDMWYSSVYANPSTQNYASGGNVVYQEGVYEGYRYAETRYEDFVMSSDRAGTYLYGTQVSYPFGYGLSYTDFSVEITGIAGTEDPAKNYYTSGSHTGIKKPDDLLRSTGDTPGDCDDITMSVKVTNTGNMPGKKAVQIYLQQPYTDRNRADGVEKVSAQLIAYGKTSKLMPGESETLGIEIDANKYFASYDRHADGKDGRNGAYILDSGTYYLAAASDSHDAVNSILKFKASSGAATYDVSKADMSIESGDADRVVTVEVSAERSASYTYMTQGGETPSNLFDMSDANVASGRDGLVTYMTRSDWVSSAGENITARGDANGIKCSIGNFGSMGDAAVLNSGWSSSFTTENVRKYYPEIDTDVEMPLFGEILEDGDSTVANLIDMKNVEYNPARGATEEDMKKWDMFMSRLTWEETYDLCSNGFRSTKACTSVNKPATNDVNASNGLQHMYNMSKTNSVCSIYGFAQRFDRAAYNQYATGYPCEGIIAASFNTDIAYAVGQAIGEDCLWAGASGLYGFGLNLHRNPRHGRAGEYYSDDPVLTGTMAGYESMGAQSKGVYVYNKHFVLNEQESSRTSYCAWITEQSLRETYLRPFEIAIETGDAMNVMSSFNNLGSGWSGNNYNLMTKWLRGEAGMAGFAVTDYYRSGGMNLCWGMLAGSDLPDGTASGANAGWDTGNYGGDVASSGYFRASVRESARRIMYVVANSNAMNFMGEDTYILTEPPAWYDVRDRITGYICLSFGIVTGCLIVTSAWAVCDGMYRDINEAYDRLTGKGRRYK